MMSTSTNTRRPARGGFERASCADDDGEPGYQMSQEKYLPAANLDIAPPDLLARIPRLFRYDNAPQEATALAMDIFARASILMSSIFLGPALLELASQAVEEQCPSSENKDECIDDGRIYGFKPSSLLSNIAIVSGVLGSIAMPLFGALVDHTPYRWQVGAFSAAGLTIIKSVETMVSYKTWFICACLQIVSAILFNMHVTTTMAYTSELSEDTVMQTGYNVYFFIVMYLSTLIFLLFVTAMAFMLDQDDVGTARISQVTTSSVCGIFFYFCWKHLFRDRPALSRVPEGQSVVSCGFYQVLNTFLRVGRELPSLKWLSIAIMFGESATATLTAIATTYMKSFLDMDSSEIGFVFLAVLTAGAPGSKLGEKISLRVNPVRSAILCNIVFIVATTSASMYLTGPEHKRYVPLVGAVWGLCLGWLHPMHTTAFITITPKGQEAELMGLYILSGQILSWLPPMLFTALNEAGFDMAFGLASLDVFFLLAIVSLLLVGDYKEASEGSVEVDGATDGLALPPIS